MDKDKLLQTFGLNIKMERIKLWLTQESVAEKLDLSSVYISNVESGKHKISLCNAYKFAKFYGESLDCLLMDRT